MTNGRRIWAAQTALDHYRRAKDGREPSERDEADFSDLLADLMHYARREGIDFAAELGRAERNVASET